MKAEQGSLVPAERKSEGPEVQGSESESQGSDTTFRCVSAEACSSASTGGDNRDPKCPSLGELGQYLVCLRKA